MSNKQPEVIPFSVNASITSCPDASRLGFDEPAINRMIVRTAEFFLFKDTRLVLGHDWREDGVMRAIAEYAQSAASAGDLGHPRFKQRLLNIVPTGGKPLTRQALDAAELSRDALSALSIRDAVDLPGYSLTKLNLKGIKWPDNWRSIWELELWVLRLLLTGLLGPGPASADRPSGLRICLGGPTHGYSGYYSGIAEEAFLALQHKKPLYLFPAFGGSTRAVYEALQGKSKHEPLSPPAANKKKPKDRDAKWRAMEAVAESLGIPDDGLGKKLAEWGLDGYRQQAGFSAAEEQEFSKLTDLETALEWIADIQGLKPISP